MTTLRFIFCKLARFAVKEKRYIVAFMKIIPHRANWRIPGVDAALGGLLALNFCAARETC
jgi:hypothetical protein